jgi:CHAD domain-containing protein
MPLDSSELDKRLKKLRKSLQGLPKDPTPDAVHDLRTRTRRVESILDALELDSGENEKKLLAGLKSVRRRAGQVRDMDVLTADVVGLGLKDDPDCVVRLVHHLGGTRQLLARKLHSTVNENGPELRRRLKQARGKVDSVVTRFSKVKFDLDNKADGKAEEGPLHAMSVALRLYKELASVPRLGQDNLHAYRIEVKRLRYVLEMADSDAGKQKPFIEELKLVQDKIGEWHDWLEMSSIAQKVLRHDRGCKLVRRIEDIAKAKFAEALRVTEEMRQRYLLPTAKGSRKNKRTKQSEVPGPVLVAASEFVA